MLRYWVWLTRAKGIGARTAARLLERFGSPEEIYHADEAALSLAGLSTRELARLTDKALDETEAILACCYAKDIRLITLQDTLYPALLRELPDAPPLLYCRGRLPELSYRAALGVVGARKASAYGMTIAKRIGYQIARCGGVVVTGLARGIDAMAAEGAVSAGMPVIGVLGCGVDVVYPPENAGLFRDVLNTGCLLSEYPPQTRPYAGNFPQRNRIISGLSDGVLVVEAGEKSGALITAALALEQGRDVFAVPGNVDNSFCDGSNRLLRDGAIAVACGWDVMREYQHRYPDTVTEFQGGEHMVRAEQLRVASPVDMPDAPAASRPIDVEPLKSALSADEYALLQQLSQGERQIDELIAGTGLAAARVLAALTVLEIKGFIKRLSGKRFTLSEK